jgi:hypothetical protein
VADFVLLNEADTADAGSMAGFGPWASRWRRHRRRSADNVANSPPGGFAPGRLRRLGARHQAGDRAGDRFSRQHCYRRAVVNDLDRLAISEGVAGRCAGDLDP